MWEKMTTDRGETMREIIKAAEENKKKLPPTPLPPPANLTKQDCGRPAAAATGGAPWDTIIGFHYAAISLK